MREAGARTAAALPLYSTLETMQWGAELFGPLLFKDEILQTPLEYRDFMPHLPVGAGLGVALDEDKVNHCRRDRIGPAQAISGAR